MNKAKKYIILFTICIVILEGAVFLVHEKNIKTNGCERMHICVSGFDMEYEEKDRKLSIEDFEQIELGSSYKSIMTNLKCNLSKACDILAITLEEYEKAKRLIEEQEK